VILSLTSATLGLFAFLTFPFAISLAQEQPNASPEIAAVKKAAVGFIDPFNRHDPHAVAMAFTEDADLTSVRGVTAHGRKEIEQFYAGVFAGRLKSAHRTASVTSVRFLARDIASVDADWEITGSKADDGSDLPLRKGILTVIVTKQNGEWLVAVFHELELTPAK
jgi:uncharacterized protein (TIGR02246 family)